MTVVRQIMQISKPVKFSRWPDTGSEQCSKRNSSLNGGLIWSFHYSKDEQIIEIITEIKFAIIANEPAERRREAGEAAAL